MKSADAFRTISEVSELLDTPAHVLRFWESRFAQIRPIKRAGGRRYYRPADVALLAGIKQLLHDDGLTIRGVQKILRERGVAHVSALSPTKVMDAVGLAPMPSPASSSRPGPVATPDAFAQPTVQPIADEAMIEGDLMLRTAEAEGDEDTFDPEAEAYVAAALEEIEAPATGHPDTAVPEIPLWSESQSPEAGAPDDHLQVDPEDPEAPMQVDVPTLPLHGHGMVTAIGRVYGRTAEPAPAAKAAAAEESEPAITEGHRTTAAVPEAEPAAAPEAEPAANPIDETPVPAARLLRAMTALRAQEHRVELSAIYQRARRLYDRLAESADQGTNAG